MRQREKWRWSKSCYRVEPSSSTYVWIVVCALHANDDNLKRRCTSSNSTSSNNSNSNNNSYNNKDEENAAWIWNEMKTPLRCWCQKFCRDKKRRTRVAPGFALLCPPSNRGICLSIHRPTTLMKYKSLSAAAVFVAVVRKTFLCERWARQGVSSYQREKTSNSTK